MFGSVSKIFSYFLAISYGVYFILIFCAVSSKPYSLKLVHGLWIKRFIIVLYQNTRFGYSRGSRPLALAPTQNLAVGAPRRSVQELLLTFG